MALTLVVLTGDPATECPVTLDGPRLFVGRAENCELRLPDYSVSPRHASFRQRGSDYLIEDEGSTNGTFVGPVRLAPHAPRVVRSGEHIRFGRVWVEATVEHVPATTRTTVATKELALKLVAKAMTAEGDSTVPRIVVREGVDQGTELSLEVPDKRYVLGRSTQCDVVLEEPNASRRHVELFVRNGQVIARELGSKNGTKLGGQPLPPDQETLWPKGAVLEIGADQILLMDPVGEALAELERAADEVMPADEEVPIPSTRSVKIPAVSPPPATSNRPPAPATRASTPDHRSSQRPPKDPPGAVTRADIFVALLALSVLALSAFGLYWLLGGH
jgi:pSer/pThr/pTyr-binding forkhead associated (FHA) protein